MIRVPESWRTWAAAYLSRFGNRRTFSADARAGLVLGVESVPDGLASGLLAGLNPLYGLYGYLFGTLTGALATGSVFMSVQATGAMSVIISDVPAAHSGEQAGAVVAMLCVLTGAIMLVLGLARAGTLVRFIPTAVLVGFVNAVAINIVLGQLATFTGYASTADNRVLRAVDTLIHIADFHWPTVLIGALTIGLILALERTRLGALGMVAAIVLASAAAAVLPGEGVALVSGVAEVPRSLPGLVMPDLSMTLTLLIPALSLALVGLVQGAAISGSIPNPDGRYPDASADFRGQGVANIVTGVFQGMPVGGSMSGSSIIVQSGAKTRLALFIAAAVMAVVVFAASDLVAFIAMPALAGLLMVVGFGAIKPSRVYSVMKSGPLPTAIMAVTFGLTLVIPLQFAVLAGVGLGIILFVGQQSNRVRVRAVHIEPGGRLRESDPPAVVPPDDVLVLQPYGSLFFASAPIFEKQLPEVSRASRNAVVIVRLRGTDQIGLSLVDVLRRFAHQLRDADSSLKVVATEDRVLDALEAGGLLDDIGERNVYKGTEWVGETLRRAHADAREEIGDRS